jgi:FixJ family two-component response regulator
LKNSLEQAGADYQSSYEAAKKMENTVSTLQSQLAKERELKDMIEREFFASKQVSEDLEKKIGD